jgi:hypothetical protein
MTLPVTELGGVFTDERLHDWFGDRVARRDSLPTCSTASVVQASGFRTDVTVFRLNAARAGDSGMEPAFRRNTAERVYTIDAAHNPEVAGQILPPLLERPRETGPFLFWAVERSSKLLPRGANELLSAGDAASCWPGQRWGRLVRPRRAGWIVAAVRLTYDLLRVIRRRRSTKEQRCAHRSCQSKRALRPIRRV